MFKTGLKQSVSKMASLRVECRVLEHANLNFQNGLSKIGTEFLEHLGPMLVVLAILVIII